MTHKIKTTFWYYMYYIKTVYSITHDTTIILALHEDVLTVLSYGCREQTANVNVNFTVWHTTKMFGGTCAPTSHPQFCIMLTGHVWFTSLLTLYTPLL